LTPLGQGVLRARAAQQQRATPPHPYAGKTRRLLELTADGRGAVARREQELRDWNEQHHSPRG
jgi:hypothetical protein